jgi:uncharacterized protein (DUF885 family)
MQIFAELKSSRTAKILLKLAAVSLFMVLADLSVAQQPANTSVDSVEQMIREFTEDQQTVGYRFRIKLNETAFEQRKQLHADWLKKLAAVNFDSLSRPGQLDYLLFKNKLEFLQAKLALDHAHEVASATDYLPFAPQLVSFCSNREEVESIDASIVADQLNRIALAVEQLTATRRSTSSELTIDQRLSALRAVELLKSLRGSLNESDSFYQGYDPNYSWWCKAPVERLRTAIDRYKSHLQNSVVGVPETDAETIIGIPIGADGLALELKHEWLAHSPEELIQLAEKEMAWCENEMRLASQAMGCGDDWRAALEKIKSNHVQPGQQPAMIRKLAEEAIEYVRSKELLTVPEMAARGWRMTMMSPDRQRINPYFLGGESIIVSFPTDTMTHDEKLMSLRSNNEHFARATVHHELIPGHHMQFYSLSRHRPYRGIFATPFWMEGWALHWEMLLWDLGFARGQEDKVGMLFWRKHRCARIIFSLNYHLGKMSPAECVEYLIQNVGHERSAAAAEVRRSIMGNYGPMYQAAYMLGGKQIRKMHAELVGSGKMTNRDFHDAILREHSIPIEPLRSYLSGEPLTKESVAKWRFAD